MEIKKDSFLRLINRINDLLPFLGLTQRQWQVVWLIIRLTHGCQKRWAKLKLSDFQVVGIFPSHIRQVIDPLTTQRIIIWNKKTKNEVRINEEYLSSKLTKEVNSELERLYELIGRNLKKRSYQSGNKKLTEEVNNDLPKKEVSTYQTGNKKVLPNREVLVSKDKGLSTPKDILNKSKDSDRKEIADYKSSKKNRLMNLSYFQPMTDVQYAAKYAWETLEPDKPESFGYYLKKATKVPPDLIYQFVSEIKQDRTIKNKGAVFVKKVEKYLVKEKS